MLNVMQNLLVTSENYRMFARELFVKTSHESISIVSVKLWYWQPPSMYAQSSLPASYAWIFLTSYFFKMELMV